MLRFSYFLFTLGCCAGLLMAFQGTAQAYVDPGSGLLALQMIGSAIAGIGFYFRQKIGRILRKVSSKEQGSSVEPTHAHDTTQPLP